MPIFFFVSGYIAYKASIEWNSKTFRSLLSKKARIQLIPTVCFFLLYTISHSYNPVTTFLNRGWAWYWFTFVLFEMFVVFYSLSFFFKKYSVFCLMALGVLGVILLVPLRSDSQWRTILCIENLCKYLQFFAIGVLAKKYNGAFMSLVRSDVAKTIALIVFITSCLLITSTDLEKDSIAVRYVVQSMIMRYAGLFVVLAFFVGKEEFFNRDTIVSRSMTFIGRRTLDIYMLHYFLIGAFTLLVPFAQQNTIMELSISVTLTIIVISVSLLMSEVIRSSNFLAHYLFGVKRNR